MESPFTLHPQLAVDTVPVGDLALTRVLLASDANYPWLILVPRFPGVTELIDLDENQQNQLIAEIDAAARAQNHHRMREAQRRHARQHGGATAYPCHRPPP